MSPTTIDGASILHEIQFVLALIWALLLNTLSRLPDLEKPPTGYYFGNLDLFNYSLTKCPVQDGRYDCPEPNLFQGIPWNAYARSPNNPTWEIWIAWLLPLVSFPANEGQIFVQYIDDELRRIAILSISQTARMVLGTVLVVSDFTRHNTNSLFWWSLFFWTVPVLPLFLHAMTGLYAICWASRPSIRLTQNISLDYQVPSGHDDSALSMALAQQHGPDRVLPPDSQGSDYSMEESSTLGTHGSFANDRSSGTSLAQAVTSIAQESPGVGGLNDARRYWTVPEHSAPLPGTRLPWQVRVMNWRPPGSGMAQDNVATTTWSALLCISALVIWYVRCYFVTVVEQYFTPQAKRVLMIQTFVPVGISSLAIIMMNLAFLWSRFTLIFLALLGHVLAALMWGIMSILMVTIGLTRPFYVEWVIALLTVSHVFFAYVAAALEWEPDFESFIRIIRRPQRGSVAIASDERAI